jgi:hypothetical protein
MRLEADMEMLGQVAAVVLPIAALFLFVVLLVRFAIPRNRRG